MRDQASQPRWRQVLDSHPHGRSSSPRVLPASRTRSPSHSYGRSRQKEGADFPALLGVRHLRSRGKQAPEPNVISDTLPFSGGCLFLFEQKTQPSGCVFLWFELFKHLHKPTSDFFQSAEFGHDLSESFVLMRSSNMLSPEDESDGVAHARVVDAINHT